MTAIRVVAEGGSLFAPSVARRGDRRGPLQAVVLAYESGLVRPAG